jgi:hypothetical protein
MKCVYCKETGHTKNKCQKMLQEKGTNLQCKFCLGHGHLASNCAEMLLARLQDFTRYSGPRVDICNSIINHGIGIGSIFIDDIYVDAFTKQKATFIVKDYNKQNIFCGTSENSIICSVVVNNNVYTITHSLRGIAALAVVEIQPTHEIPWWIEAYRNLKTQDMQEYWPPGFKSFLSRSQIRKSNEVAEKYGLPVF